jgi:type 1 fimbria pilin
MKKIFVTLATIGLLSTGAFAADGGKKSETTVSSYVQNEFDSEFGDATNVVWTVTANSQKATFVLDGVAMTAFYNLQGEYLGVTQDVTYSSISAKAQKEIAAEYKGYTPADVIKLTTNDASSAFDQTIYFVDLKNDANEVLVRVTPSSDVYFFKQVK